MSLPIVSMNTAIEIVKQAYEEEDKRPLFLLGKGGIGKSEMIETLAKKELGIGYIDIRLLLYTETDMKGIPYPDTEHVYTIWLQNDILPRVDRDGERGILVFDEITSATKTVRTSIYQLINERRLGNYILPEHWMVVCLGNGEKDGGDYNGMEGNFANRCSMVRVEPDIESYKNYGAKSGLNTAVLAYLSWAPGDLHTYSDDDGTEDGLLFASPRSWKAVSDLLNKAGGELNNLTALRIKASIGTLVGEKFITFVKYSNQNVDVNSILSGTTSKIPDSTEAVHMTIQALIAQMNKEVHMSYNNTQSVTPVVTQRCAMGIKWILSLKKLEYTMMGIKDFVSIGKKPVINMLIGNDFDKLCPELDKFAEAHSEVFRPDSI